MELCFSLEICHFGAIRSNEAGYFRVIDIEFDSDDSERCGDFPFTAYTMHPVDRMAALPNQRLAAQFPGADVD
jgi:hypothetical protein